MNERRSAPFRRRPGARLGHPFAAFGAFAAFALAPSRAAADALPGQQPAQLASPPPPSKPPPSPAAPYEETARRTVYGILTGGFLYSRVFGSASANALGGEATYVLYRDGGMVGAGFFGQAQSYGGTHGRYALGGQVNYSVFGVELGAAYRAPTAGFRGTTGLHVGPFFSLGVVSLALRFVVPLVGAQGDRAAYPAEVGLSAALKLPLLGLPEGPEPFSGPARPR